MSVAGSVGAGLSRRWGDLLQPAVCLRIAIIAALILISYWATVRHALIGRWQSDGNWSHGWLVPLFSLYFLAMHRDRLSPSRSKVNYLGAVILAASLLLSFVSAWWWRMTYPQALSIVGAIFGVTLLLGGWGVIRVAWFPILFLLLAVPLPRRLYAELTLPLRSLASWAAAAVMPIFSPGLHTEAQAVVIDYMTAGGVTGQLNVEEACSGMRLMMAFVTLGVAMAYLTYRPTWQRIVMVLSCVPIAVFCNMIRVTTTGLFYVNGQESWAKGTPHQLLGIVMLGLALGLFALIGYALNHLFVEDPQDSTACGRILE